MHNFQMLNSNAPAKREQSNSPYIKVHTTQLNHLASLAKWLSVPLQTKWLSVMGSNPVAITYT